MSDMAMTLVVVLKGLNELILFTLLGQAVLCLLAGNRRRENPIYGAFDLLSSRVFFVFRRIVPRRVPDGRIPVLSFAALLLLELLLIAAKIALYVSVVSRQS